MVRVSGGTAILQGVSFQPFHVVKPNFLAAACVALSESCPERSGCHTRRGWGLFF